MIEKSRYFGSFITNFAILNALDGRKREFDDRKWMINYIRDRAGDFENKSRPWQNYPRRIIHYKIFAFSNFLKHG